MVYSIENKLDQKSEVLDSNLGAKDKMNPADQIIREPGRHYFLINSLVRWNKFFLHQIIRQL